MYDIPQTMQLRLFGSDGEPLSGAQVSMFQYCNRPGLGQVITNQVKASGVADADGIFTLPNVHINSSLVPEIGTGDQLHNNPFGYVDCVGTDGVLLFKVQYEGATDYCWLDITEANIAYWQGNTTTAVFGRQLALGGPVQTRPPADMAEGNASDWLAWARAASPPCRTTPAACWPAIRLCNSPRTEAPTPISDIRGLTMPNGTSPTQRA